MRKIIIFVKIIFMHDTFMHELCELYGNPEDVKNHLVKISEEHPYLSRFLKRDIEEMDAALREKVERETAESAEIAWEKENYPCIDCQFGNGMPYCNCGIICEYNE